MSKKKNYQKRKSEKSCTQCGEQDERTLDGYSRCIRCTERARFRDRARNKRKSRKISNYQKICQRVREATKLNLSYGKYSIMIEQEVKK